MHAACRERVCPVTVRSLEIAAIGAFLGLTLMLGAYLWVHATAMGGFAGWVVLGLAGAAYLAADFVSGFVHFLADNFGHPSTPWFGPAFVRPFREHHVDPIAITRHDFVEVNGNNCIVGLPALVPLWWELPEAPGILELTLASFAAVFFAAIFLTNQIHQWAHAEHPPRWVARLQAAGLILSPENHNVHHTAPHDTYYCITWGVLNPVLERIGFFRIFLRVARCCAQPPSTMPLRPREPLHD